MGQVVFMMGTYIALIGGVILSLISLWQEKHQAEKFAVFSLALASLLLFINLMLRAKAIGRLPFTSLYEFTLWFVFGVLVAYLFVRRHLKSPAFTVMASLVAVAVFSYAGTLSSQASELMPALKSPWLTAHVVTSIAAYGFFGIAFCTGVLHLIKSQSQNTEAHGIIPAASKLSQVTYQCIIIGFAFQTLLLITGAVWAEAVWGAWWSWDPKETWALITWLVYAAYLHGYKKWNLEGAKSSWFAIIGFAIVLFTLFGVSFLLGGLHAY